MTYYATTFAEEGYIKKYADIEAFKTREEAVEWLTIGAGDLDEDEELIIEEGRFAGVWIDAEQPEICDIRPFRSDQMIVRAPGSHPGGPCYWLTPEPPVLIATIRNTGDDRP